MKPHIAFALWLLAGIPTIGGEARHAFHVSMAKFDEVAIVKFCKDAIAKFEPEVDLADLDLYAIEYVRNFDGAYEPFPVELKVTFLISSSREIYHPSAFAKERGARVSYSAISVSIDPEGNVEKSVVKKSGMGCGIDLTKTKKAEQAGAGQPATRPESKSQGGDKPQPEAEGRSR